MTNAVFFFSSLRRAASCAAIILFLVAIFPALAEPAPEDWKLSSRADGVTIYARVRPGTSIKEFKAVGEIAAPTLAVHHVLTDVDAYPHFMPYVKECHRIAQDGEASTVSYQRISPPLITDRDYTIRARHQAEPGAGGTIFHTRWELANDLGPAEHAGVVRVKINEGSWLLEPAAGNTTHATYCIYTDSGGALPAFVANKANQVGIGKLFAAIRQQVKDAKYQTPHGVPAGN